MEFNCHKPQSIYDLANLLALIRQIWFCERLCLWRDVYVISVSVRNIYWDCSIPRAFIVLTRNKSLALPWWFAVALCANFFFPSAIHRFVWTEDGLIFFFRYCNEDWIKHSTSYCSYSYMECVIGAFSMELYNVVQRLVILHITCFLN